MITPSHQTLMPYGVVPFKSPSELGSDMRHGLNSSIKDCVVRFCLKFFHESSSTRPQIITLGSKILGDIRKSRCTTGINDTRGKFAKVVNSRMPHNRINSKKRNISQSPQGRQHQKEHQHQW